jgi:hypothetical protein
MLFFDKIVSWEFLCTGNRFPQEMSDEKFSVALYKSFRAKESNMENRYISIKSGNFGV